MSEDRTAEMVEVIAREIWRFNECPWDFDKPIGGMMELQKQLAIDQAKGIVEALAKNHDEGLMEMAMDQQETFNWLVAEKARLEAEVELLRTDRDKWAETAFDLAFEAARTNPAIFAQIKVAKEAETPTPDVLNFVLRGQQ